MKKNKHAQALVRLARGVKKTMTPAAIKQRREANRKRWAKGKMNKTKTDASAQDGSPVRSTGLLGLSSLAQELYAAMQKGVVCHYMPYMGRFNPNAYYFRTDSHKRCTKQAESLLKAGLVEKRDEDWRGHVLTVKPNSAIVSGDIRS